MDQNKLTHIPSLDSCYPDVMSAAWTAQSSLGETRCIRPRSAPESRRIPSARAQALAAFVAILARRSHQELELDNGVANQGLKGNESGDET